MNRTTPPALPRRVWVESLLGSLGVLLAIAISNALAENTAPQMLVNLVAAALAFTLIRRALSAEIKHAAISQSELQESREQVAMIVEGNSDGFWDWNVSTGEGSYSRRWAEMFGYDPEDVKGTISFCRDLIHPEDRPRVMSTLESHLEGKTPTYECEERLRTKSGEWKWVLDRGRVVSRDSEGRPLRVVGTHTDISEWKRTQTVLKEIETNYRSLFEHMLEGFAYCRMIFKDGRGCDFTFLQVNRAFEQLLGVQTVAGQKASETVPGLRKSAPGLFELLGRVALTGRPEKFEVYHEPLDLWLAISAYSPGEGLFISVFDDITQRKRAEKALREGEERYRLLVESIPLNAWRTDPEGRVRECNHRWYEYTGQTAEEAKDFGWMHAIHPDDLPAVRQSMLAAKGSQTNYEAEYRLRRASDGAYRWHLARALPIRGTDGKISDWFGCATDVHDQKEAQEAWRASESRYRSLLDAVTDAFFVHELLEDGSAGHFIEVNDIACERLGYSHEELLRLTPRDITAENGTGEYAAISKRLQGGLATRFEQRLRTKDGRPVPVEIHARRFDLQGRSAVISLARDITERHRAEETIRASESRLLEAMEIGRLGYWEYDVQTDRVTGTDLMRLLSGAEAVTDDDRGISREEFVRNYVHPEDVSLLLAQIQNAIADSQYQGQVTVRFMGRDGVASWHSVRCKSIPGQSGRTKKIVGSAQNINEAVRAEEELRRQHAFLTAIIEHAAEGICVYQAHRQPLSLEFTVWNERMTQITGYTMEFINEHGWCETLYPDPAAQRRARERLFKLVPNEDLIEEEWQIARADGEKRIVAVSTSVLRSPSGSTQVLALMQDITERKRVQEELRLQHSALEAAANGIVIADRVGNILWVNDAFTTLTGYSRWEVIGQNTRLLKSSKNALPFYKVMWDTILTGSTWHGELTNRRKDGSLYEEEMTITPVRDASGNIGQFIAIKQDITERRKSERQLKEQARLLDLAQDAILVRNFDDGKIQYWNEGAERVYGWTREEVIDKTAAELIYKTSTALDTANEELLEQGHWEGELQQLRKDQHSITVFCRWTLIQDDSGAPAVLDINSDITDRKFLEEQVWQAKQMEGINTLATGVAHDLNNILTPIMMAAQMLKSEGMDDRKRKLLDHIEESTMRGGDIVKLLLINARGKGDFIPVPVPLQRLITGIVKLVKGTFPRAIEVQTSGTETPAQILGDATQLNQVLFNLCLNARDAMPDGGTLRLSVNIIQLDPQRAKKNPEAKPGLYVVISIEDTGSGIPAENLERIFDAGYTTKKVGQGTGVGLMLVRSIVKNHGGFIEVASEVGLGTEFKVFLPASQQNVALVSAPVRPVVHGQGELILLVDDEEKIRNIAKEALEKSGYRVITATDGKEALELFVQKRPDITAALIDVVMPNMGGVALGDALLRLRPDLRLMVMTGYATETQETQFRALGVTQFLPKPFSPDDLLRELRDLIERAPGKPQSKGPLINRGD